MGLSTIMPVPLVVSTRQEKSWAGSSPSPRVCLTTTVERELAATVKVSSRVVPSPSM